MQHLASNIFVLGLVVAYAAIFCDAFAPPSNLPALGLQTAKSTTSKPPNLRSERRSPAIAMLSRWANPDWRWGYGVGLAHDEAAILRSKLRSPEQRSAWLDAVVSATGEVDWEEVKLALALKWQRANRERDDDAISAYNQVMEQLRKAKYEGEEEDMLFVKDMEVRLKFFGDVSQSLLLDFRGKQAAESPAVVDSSDGRRRVIAATVLEGFDFVGLGL